MVTVSIPQSRSKDVNMKLFLIITTLVVLSYANDIEIQEIADSEAAASVELLKEPRESLEPAASAYNYAQSNANTWSSQSNYVPPQNTINPVSETSKNYAESKYYAPQNNYVPPQNSYVPPQNSYVPPQNSYVPPQNSYVPPQNNYVPPQNNYAPPQNYYPQNTWAPPTYYPTTTTPSSVIKNELNYGDNGSYNYEYQITDGTHVGEQGYFTDPKGSEESLVKKGWYSYPGADGKIYTVTYWADSTGFHATGDHLPTPPPVPPAIQAALDQKAKEEAAKAEAEKNKPSTGYYPNQPTYYPNQPTYYPNQPTYNPNQPTYYPNQPIYTQPSNPSYGK